MPYPMIHLAVAREIEKKGLPKEIDLGKYYIGSIAPDAVHFRENFEKDMKKYSHLTPEWEEWGVCDDNETWMSNVENRLFPFIDQEEGFYLGWIIHILTDLRWNIEHWTPFRRKYLSDPSKLYGSNMHKEQGEIEYKLFLDYGDESERILSLMKDIDANKIKLKDVTSITNEELEKMLDNIINKQYRNKKIDETFKFHHLTKEIMQKFINDTADFLYNLLLQGESEEETA